MQPLYDDVLSTTVFQHKALQSTTCAMPSSDSRKRLFVIAFKMKVPNVHAVIDTSLARHSDITLATNWCLGGLKSRAVEDLRFCRHTCVCEPLIVNVWGCPSFFLQFVTANEML
jgi:hypothetical protein